MNIRIHSEYEDDMIFFNHATKTDHVQNDYFIHYHDVYEVLLIKTGDVSYQINGENYDLQKNTLVLSRPNERHCICVNGTSPYERYNILFDETAFSAEILEKIPENLHIMSFDGNPVVIQVFEKMDFYCEHLTGPSLGRILLHLIEETIANIVIETNTDGKGVGQNPMILHAVSYIEKNLMNIGCIEDICGELYVSKSHLHHLFLTHLGTTPKRYITEKRLHLARREILLGGKATEIYGKYGFTDYSSFFRAYKKYFGCSPSETGHGDSSRISFSDILKGYQD